MGFRIAARTAHLGAASAFIKVSREAGSAPARPMPDSVRPEARKAPEAPVTPAVAAP